MHCVLSKADLSGSASYAISVAAIFAALRLLVMSFMTYLTALIAGPPGLGTPNLLQNAEGSRHLLMWHKNQKAASHCLTAILRVAMT